VLVSGICVVVLPGPLMLVVAETNVHGKEVCSVCDNIATKVVVLVFHVHDKMVLVAHTINWVLNSCYNYNVHLDCLTTVACVHF